MVKQLTVFLLVSLLFLISVTAYSKQSPINIIFNVHIEDMGENLGNTNPALYLPRRNEVNWLLNTANSFGAKLNLQSNGEYMEYCLENGHANDFANYLSAGHDVGTHAHAILKLAPHDWQRVISVEPIPLSVTSQTWTDAKNLVDSVIQTAGYDETIINNTMSAQLWEHSLMSSLNYRIRGGGPSEELFIYFGHGAWNVWRPGVLGGLDEDITQTQFITVPHTSQIGIAEDHGEITRRRYLDNTVPALKKRFLMLYLEWLNQERTNAADKVWAWGWNTHAQVTMLYHSDISEMLTWLNNNFINQVSAQGNTICHFASFTHTNNDFLTWEASHPGTSSFEYNEGDPYPYSFEPMALRLWNKKDGQTSYYDSEKANWINQGIHCHKLTYQESADTEQLSLYILWKDSGNTTIDFDTELSDPLKITSLLNGSESYYNSHSLFVDENPVFVEKSDMAPTAIVTPTATTTLTSKTTLSIYPNPAQNQINILLQLNEVTDINIEIYNVSGDRVTSLKESSMSIGSQIIICNCSSLAPGIYFATFQGKGIHQIRKFAIVK